MNDLATKPQAPSQRLASVERRVIDEEQAGQRLDNWLMRWAKGVPKSHVYRLVRSGQVRVNGARCKPEQRLALGDEVRLPPVQLAQRQSADQAPPVEFAVVFEDNYLLVVDKPAGVAVHGGSGVSSGVIEQLRAARPDAKFLELVHRLDRDTSGLLMIAKKRMALVELQRQLRERESGKWYAAWVLGRWPRRTRNLTWPLLKRELPSGEKHVSVSESGQSAHTRVLGLQHASITIDHREVEVSLVQCELLTGRTHQIRVHLAHAGCPIVGDERYGQFDTNKALAKRGIKRMMLHAEKLQVKHPETGQPLVLTAPLPPAFELAGKAQLITEKNDRGTDE
jgi:23S rRNA pseudouridine955/2504/2580 synthase